MWIRTYSINSQWIEFQKCMYVPEGSKHTICVHGYEVRRLESLIQNVADVNGALCLAMNNSVTQIMYH